MDTDRSADRMTAQKQAFSVHKDLLVAKSAFFAKALDNRDASAENTTARWIEGETGIVRLPEDDPGLFATYLRLLYSGKAPAFQRSEGLNDEEDQSIQREKAMRQNSIFIKTCSQLYVFCEKIQDLGSKRTLLESMVQASTIKTSRSHSYPGVKVVNILYEGTAASDPIRKFLRDVAVLRGRETWIKNIPRYNTEYLQDIVASVYRTEVALHSMHASFQMFLSTAGGSTQARKKA